VSGVGCRSLNSNLRLRLRLPTPDFKAASSIAICPLAIGRLIGSQLARDMFSYSRANSAPTER